LAAERNVKNKPQLPVHKPLPDGAGGAGAPIPELNNIVRLQGLIGNRAVQRLLQQGQLSSALSIQRAPGDNGTGADVPAKEQLSPRQENVLNQAEQHGVTIPDSMLEQGIEEQAEAAPNMSVDPNAAEQPNMSVDPNAADQPNMSVDPNAADQPNMSVDPNAADQPNMSVDPNAADQPNMSVDPNAADQPNMSVDPNAADQPNMSVDPNAADQPNMSVDPNAADQPNMSVDPNAADQPNMSVDPNASDQPNMSMPEDEAVSTEGDQFSSEGEAENQSLPQGEGATPPAPPKGKTAAAEQKGQKEAAKTGSTATTTPDGKTPPPEGETNPDGTPAKTPASALVDTELAEHQRWGKVGQANSSERANFVLSSIGSGAYQGFKTGAVMGLGVGLGTRATLYGVGLATAKYGPRIAGNAAKFTPVPAVGAIIAGGFAIHSLVTRDWKSSWNDITSFGQGSSTYEKIANTLQSISTILEIVSSIASTIGGILGLISAGMWVAAVLSAGVLSPLAATLSSIAGVITVVTQVVDLINQTVLQPCIILFRALHTYTTDADPKMVSEQGTKLSQAAAGPAAALGAFAGGKLAEVGGAKPKPAAKTADAPPPDAPVNAASGDGPTVRVEETPAVTTGKPGDQLSLPLGDAPAPKPAEQLSLPLGDAPAPSNTAGGEQMSLDFNAPPPAAQQPQGMGPLQPDVTLPIQYPDASVGPSDVGFSTSHGNQAPRGSTQISEHVVPGAQWEALSTPKDAAGVPTGEPPIYKSQKGKHYKNDETLRVEKDLADYKTHETANSDNRRTQDIKNMDNPNIIEDLYLPSIEQTKTARDNTPNSQVTDGQIVYTATQEMQNKFDMGAGDIRKGTTNRDRGAEIGAVGDKVAPVGGVHGDYDWHGTFNPDGPTPGEQLPLFGYEPVPTKPTAPAADANVPPQTADPNQMSLDFNPRPQTPDAPAPTAKEPTQTEFDFSPQGWIYDKMRAFAGMGDSKGNAMKNYETVSGAEKGLREYLPAWMYTRPTGYRPRTYAKYTAKNAIAEEAKKEQEQEQANAAAADPSASAAPETQPEQIDLPVQPLYTPPPATPQDVQALESEIGQLTEKQGDAAAVEKKAKKEVKTGQDYQTLADEKVAETADSMTIAQDHQAKVTEKKTKNEEGKAKQAEAAETAGSYEEKAAGMATLKTLLNGFLGFMHLVSYIPSDSAQEAAHSMSTDARNFLASLDEASSGIAGVTAQAPQQQAAIAQTGQQLDQTQTQNQQTQTQLTTANEGAKGLAMVNKSQTDNAQQVQEKAQDQREQIAADIGKRTEQKQEMVTQMDQWAQLHQQERQTALADVSQKAQQQGYKVVEVQQA
jgi:hypothetical protein